MLKIDPKFQNFVPPLSDQEKEALERDIIANGCREPIVTWNGTIIDGHHRYDICCRNDIPFQTREETFSSREEALLWMYKEQTARRNLTPVGRIVLALKCRTALLELGKKNMGYRSDLHGLIDGAAGNHNTRAILAKMANTSEFSVECISKIWPIADDALKADLLNERVSIRKVYNRLFPGIKKKQPTPVQVMKESQEQPLVQQEPPSTQQESPFAPQEPLSEPQEPVEEKKPLKALRTASPVQTIDWDNDPRRPTIAHPIEVCPVQIDRPITGDDVKSKISDAMSAVKTPVEIALKWINEEKAGTVDWNSLIRIVKRACGVLEKAIQNKKSEFDSTNLTEASQDTQELPDTISSQLDSIIDNYLASLESTMELYTAGIRTPEHNKEIENRIKSTDRKAKEILKEYLPVAKSA